VLEGSWAAYSELLEKDLHPTLEGLSDTLAVQASWDSKAAKAKPEDFVDLRFVNNLKRSGYIEKLYVEKGSAVINAPVPVDRKSGR
jgi:hypothetical protein